MKSITNNNVPTSDTINQNEIPSVKVVDDNYFSFDIPARNSLLSGENTIDFSSELAQRTLSPLLDVNNVSGETFKSDSASVNVGINEVDNEHQDVVIEFIDQQTNSSTNDKCKCLQKLMNKIDYFQKKVLKQVGFYRQETAKSIRELTDRVDVLLNSHNIQDDVADAPITSSDEFEVQFKAMFPIAVNKMLVEASNKVKNERDFKKRLLLMLNQKTEENETKATRKILKSLCSASCLSGFTWTGTPATTKKLSFSSLEPLIDVITQVIEDQFPKCNAYGILKHVVQQRTKSANESASKMKEVESSNGTDLTGRIENQELDLSEGSSDGPAAVNQAAIEPSSSNAEGLETDQHQVSNQDNE